MTAVKPPRAKNLIIRHDVDVITDPKFFSFMNYSEILNCFN